MIATGTPGGVGHARKPPRYLTDGAVLVTTIAGVGECRNTCRAGAVMRPVGSPTPWPGPATAPRTCAGCMARMGDDAFAAPSALPGWSRAHVLTHIARNADANDQPADLGPHR